ncbi:30923_t:CDS:2 [Gigaspora margarita]|uniref:30923_t:CDS:1 n=1 Tax=Gigaspora margarita TaxID=4874 RepID=A0ABN7VVD5_GIGMA|nr:30923_t:CDS:2 [Gigaspora margarita]
MEQIEYYIIHSRCDATMIRHLLQPKYPEHVFLIQDLGNAIQKIKREKGIKLSDAASLLTKLLELQSSNPAWFVKPLIDDMSNRLIGIFWMLPEQRERWAKFYNIIIHDNTTQTNKYNLLLSLFILINNQNKSRLAAQAFMQDKRQESYKWLLQYCLEACEIAPLTFVTNADPAMIAAISTIFSQTRHIQCLYHLYQNIPKNFRLCLGSLYQDFLKDFKNIQCSHCEEIFERRVQDLIEKYTPGERYISTILLNRKHTWSINNRYSIWKASTLQYMQPFVIQLFFNSISLIISKYLTQPIHDVHYKQMCQSVCYRIYKVPISEIPLSDDDSFEPFFEKSNDNIESSVEADEDREINLQSLITIVDYSEILEIWKVSHYNYPKCYQHIILLTYFHLKLIPNHWYKDKYIDSDKNYSNEIVASNSSYSDTPANKLKYGILMGEAKQAIQYALENRNDELIQFVKKFNKRKEDQRAQAESTKQ